MTELTELRRLLARQHGVTSRAQALASGLTPEMLRHRIRAAGPWQRILPGVYLTVTGTPTTDQRDMAALLYAGPESIIAAAAALRRHGLRAPATRAVDVLVPVGGRRGSHQVSDLDAPRPSTSSRYLAYRQRRVDRIT